MPTEQKAITQPLLVSIQSAAAILGVSARTVQYALSRHELPRRKVGRRTLIPYSALVAFARRDHAVPARAEARREACTEDEGKEHS